MGRPLRPTTASGETRFSPYAEDLTPLERDFVSDMHAYLGATRSCNVCGEQRPVDLYSDDRSRVCGPCTSEQRHNAAVIRTGLRRLAS
jgi:hypothetical protein